MMLFSRKTLKPLNMFIFESTINLSWMIDVKSCSDSSTEVSVFVLSEFNISGIKDPGFEENARDSLSSLPNIY